MSGKYTGFFKTVKLDIFVIAVILLATPEAQLMNNTISGAGKDARVYNCMLTAHRMATALGSVLLIETIFCILVMYLWIKGRRSPKRTEQLSPNSKQDGGSCNAEKSQNITPCEKKNGANSSTIRSHQNPMSKNGNVLSRKMGDFLSKFNTSHHSSQEGRGYAPDVEEGNHVYSVIYDDHVIEVASNGVTNQEASNGPQVANDPFYYVLEEAGSPLAQDVMNSLYYCSEDCVDKTGKEDPSYYVLEELGNPLPNETPKHNSLYYCSGYCVDKPTLSTPHSQSKPSTNEVIFQTPNTQNFKIKPLPRKPDNHNQSKSRMNSNQKAGKPIKCNLGKKGELIREMKSRAAIKNSKN